MKNIFKKTIFFVIAFLFVMVNSIQVVKAYIIDYPTVPFVILLLSFVVMIIIEKVVLS